MSPRPGQLRPTVKIAVALATATAALTGCGSSSAPPTVPAGYTSALVRATAISGRLASNSLVVPFRFEQRSATLPATRPPQAWVTSALHPSSTSLPVEWTTGECDGKDRPVVAYVDERPDRVVVDIYDDPKLGSGTCSAVGLPAVATVELDAPLGHRRLMRHALQYTGDGAGAG